MFAFEKKYNWTHAREQKPRIFSKLNKIRQNDRTGNNNESAPPARETFANFRLKQQLRTWNVCEYPTRYIISHIGKANILLEHPATDMMCVYRVLFLFDETRSRTHIYSVKASNFPHPVNVKLNYSLFSRRGCWSVVCEPRMRTRIRPVLTY